MDKTTETIEPLPDLKLAPDGLFGDSAELDGACDVDSLWPLISGGELSFFNLPLLEQLHRRPYHLIKLRGEFNPAKLLRDFQSQLLRSECDQTQKKKTHVADQRRKLKILERETRIELATNSLEGCDSTIELLPRLRLFYHPSATRPLKIA